MSAKFDVQSYPLPAKLKADVSAGVIPTAAAANGGGDGVGGGPTMEAEGVSQPWKKWWWKLSSLVIDKHSSLLQRQVAQFSNKQRHKIVEKGVVPPLILMLSTNDYEAIEAALFALLSIAFRSERNKILIAKSGAIPELLDVLQCENKVLVELGVAFLLTLSSCASNKLVIAASGAIQHLLELLNSQSYNSIMIRQANLDILSTLHNLSTCHPLIPSIVSYGGVATLLGLINLASELVIESCGVARESCFFIKNLTIGSCRNRGSNPVLGGAHEGRQIQRDDLKRMSDGSAASVECGWNKKSQSQKPVLLLRDCSNCGQTTKQPKNIVLLEQIMRQIERGVGEGMSVALLEEMISKFRT
ncbi:hypothetical protein RND71_034083 [Anisodus tanguticus]|uniref:Uncharacterized protein n=1 Tax=Anisodus tanguticus TaxID=243964 RepID=A0AAE1R8X2_9SOLA|nr:hypothetical protein RND71_034083 [Anisodus tanguticus]